MEYRRCGSSGLRVSPVSLGFWKNHGAYSDERETRDVILTAFDRGVNSFDLANNYGPPAGSAELRFGKIMKRDLLPYRDEIIVSTKAGYPMWDGPLGDGGSKKYLTASIDQSLKRTGLDYFDIFYHHREDKNTPLEETAEALSYIQKSGRALYIALSNYGENLFEMKRILEEDYKTTLIIDQVSYSILSRRGDEKGTLFPSLKKEGVGIFAFSPLSQGRLTEKYLSGLIPPSSRAEDNPFLITPDIVTALNSLNKMAEKRGQKINHMALNWVLEREGMTSVIVGARDKYQLLDSLKSLDNYSPFSLEEENMIKEIVKDISFRR